MTISVKLERGGVPFLERASVPNLHARRTFVNPVPCGDPETEMDAWRRMCVIHSSFMSLDALQIEADIARACTLPASLYVDPTVFAEERVKIFSRTWQVVGHVSQVASPGDYFTTELAGGT